MSVSDGITDAKRDRNPIRYTSSRVNPAPSKCRNCIFIIRNPHDNQWECTNPLQHSPCNESNNCAFYLTIEELAVYFRQRLKAKLTGNDMCEYIVPIGDHYVKCNNVEWCHSNTYICEYGGDKSECEFWKAKLTGESNVSNKTPRCKHILDDDCGKCSKIDEFECPFVGMWDIATTLCKSYEANLRYEVHILGNSTSIIGAFKSREQADQFIKDNVKIVEMTS